MWNGASASCGTGLPPHVERGFRLMWNEASASCGTRLPPHAERPFPAILPVFSPITLSSLIFPLTEFLENYVKYYKKKKQ
ncbi:hypothetical protein Barb4_01980 [Bacteroidales bacterium Barb4]|nr:hypothetical protein Barb4_01980 [Bacteroidales bacterium Barb4]